jgi:hypothetical protein
MKSILTTLFFSFALWATGQNVVLDNLFKTASHSRSKEEAQSRISNFVQEQLLKKGQKKSEVQFLNSLVKNTHQQFLKTYKPYTQINEPFETGTYDCLTGTALFSLIFTELGIHHKMIETNYHIFLLIESKEGRVLLETTDRLFGLKVKSKEVDQWLEKYQQNTLTASSTNSVYYQYKADLFREISLNQLPGLLYFNQAVVAFNSHDLATCVDQLEKAKRTYDNPRIKELALIVTEAVSASLLSEKEKYSLLIQLASFRDTMIASR